MTRENHDPHKGSPDRSESPVDLSQYLFRVERTLGSPASASNDIGIILSLASDIAGSDGDYAAEHVLTCLDGDDDGKKLSSWMDEHFSEGPSLLNAINLTANMGQEQTLSAGIASDAKSAILEKLQGLARQKPGFARLCALYVLAITLYEQVDQNKGGARAYDPVVDGTIFLATPHSS